jgi:hypothetical protein
VFVHGSRSKRPVDNGRWDEKVFPEQTIPLFPGFPGTGGGSPLLRMHKCAEIPTGEVEIKTLSSVQFAILRE